jgi:hypothetical protein
MLGKASNTGEHQGWKMVAPTPSQRAPVVGCKHERRSVCRRAPVHRKAVARCVLNEGRFRSCPENGRKSFFISLLICEIEEPIFKAASSRAAASTQAGGLGRDLGTAKCFFRKQTRQVVENITLRPKIGQNNPNLGRSLIRKRLSNSFGHSRFLRLTFE